MLLIFVAFPMAFSHCGLTLETIVMLSHEPGGEQARALVAHKVQHKSELVARLVASCDVGAAGICTQPTSSCTGCMHA